MAQRRGSVQVVRVGYSGDDHGLQWAQCRMAALGHEWHHVGPITDDSELGYKVPISLPANSIGYRSQCSNCSTTKVKWMSRRGFESVTRYYHPDGYSRQGEEALSPQEWREQWFLTLLGPEEPKARKRAA